MRALAMGRGITIPGLLLILIALLFTGTSWAQQAAPAPEQPKVKVKQPTEEERPPAELKPSQQPGYFPSVSVTSPQRPLTMEIGPVSGILAPYGNPAALDPLRMGKALKAGPLLVAPYLENDVGFRSNFFQTPTNKLATGVYSVNPGMYVELPMAKSSKVSVGYLGNGYVYTGKTLGDFSHYDNNVNVDATANFSSGLSLRAGNYLRTATEEPSATSQIQRFYHQWAPYFLANYAFADRWKIQAIYEFNRLWYAANTLSNANDYNDNIGGLSLYYKILPKTAVFGQFVVGHRSYPSQSISSNLYYSPFLGLTWDPTAKLSGLVKMGFTVKHYDNPAPGLVQAPTTPSLSAQLTYKLDRRTNLSLTAQRGIQQDSDLATNAPYVNSAFYFTFDHLWPYWKVTSYANIGYVYNYYLNRTQDPGDGFKFRNDNIITAGFGLSRPLTRYLRLRLDYSYSNKASNFTGYSYNDHRILFGIQATM